ncbi:MAG: hypothetical protein DCC55_28130 [Chloroflexi bacterium]|nr:MAG: hypothetical protein DCC55_28130 [Chloroflexota bacterium]
MTTYTLTVVDTGGVQDYMFSTNNLSQNAGASFLADCATRRWLVEALPVRRNVELVDERLDFDDQKRIEAGDLDAELIYAGGGNAVIVFANQELAITFTRQLTRQILLDAPGLQITVEHQNFDWGTKSLGGKEGVVACTIKQLGLRKQIRPEISQQLGLGVTAKCVFTGLPAVAYDRNDQDGRPVAAGAWFKVHHEYSWPADRPTAYTRLCTLIDFGDYKPPRDFEALGRTEGESSYIAVIHVDGNRMGKRVERISETYPQPSQSRAYIQAIRNFSRSVEQASLTSLQATVDLLKWNVKEKSFVDQEGVERTGHFIGPIRLKPGTSNDGRLPLPFRPLVFGGDDVTFVCDGRLGLVLTAYYLQNFSSQELSDGEKAHCRAGVAVVHSHFPFARAYDLAESLCKSAKAALKDWQVAANEDEGITAFDWHFAVSGLMLGLDEVREREYTSDGEPNRSARPGDLLMRPLRLNQPDLDWRTWRTFRNVLSEFTGGDTWRNRRNKVIDLREVLRKGSRAVELFRLLNDIKTLPAIPDGEDMMLRGWKGGECGYFDAIEALDFWVELEESEAHA